MCNKDIKMIAKEAGVKLWQIAEKFNGGMNDGNFSRKLRRELSENEKEIIRSIIAEIKAGEKNVE